LRFSLRRFISSTPAERGRTDWSRLTVVAKAVFQRGEVQRGLENTDGAAFLHKKM
jgi:hypothetical protein